MSLLLYETGRCEVMIDNNCDPCDQGFLYIYVLGVNESLRWRHNGRDGVSNHQPRDQAQIKENIKAPRHWPLCGKFTGDRWIPHTNGQ